MPAAAAGAGVLVSAWSAVEGGKRADRAYALQEAGLAQDQAFRQQQLDDYNKTYGPMIKSLTQQASSEQPLNLGPNWANIQSTFDQAGRNNEASLARKGLLGSGIDRNNNLEVGRGMALTDAYSKGLQSKQALMQQLVEAGKRMPGQTEAVMQGNQNMAGFYGNQGNLYANAAAQGWQGVGNGLGSMGYFLTRQNGASPRTAYNGAEDFTTPGTTSLSQSRFLENSPISSTVATPQAQPVVAPMTAQDQSMAGTMFGSSPIQSEMTPAVQLQDFTEAPWKTW